MLDSLNTALSGIGALAPLAQLALEVHRDRKKESEDEKEPLSSGGREPERKEAPLRAALKGQREAGLRVVPGWCGLG
ncbi:hypothetical protein ACIOFQ_32785 [[Kitasatospora] papulosa]|uniref:hypothetical protein n=1 Tax=[Kitasatospora] papulosa TaxID=1464011 RepID=UPI0016891D4D|nr:hypothetical protein [Streptomyces pratensis]